MLFDLPDFEKEPKKQSKPDNVWTRARESDPLRFVKKARPRPDLPQFYYHSNFCEMLDFVSEKYAHILQDSERALAEDFYALPHKAQCLYVRFAGRKGRVFDIAKLDYAEIGDLTAPLDSLRGAGFATSLREDNYSDYLMALTKPELTALLSAHVPLRHYKKSWKKDALVDVARAHIPFTPDLIASQIAVQDRVEVLQYYLYLYFGKIETNLQNFTLRDLGVVKTPDFKSDYEPRFDEAGQARAAYFYARALHDFKTGAAQDTAPLIDSLADWPKPQCEVSSAGRDKLLQKLGGLSERLGDIDTALTLYGQTDAPLCNERVIRLRYARGDIALQDQDWVKTRLEQLIDAPGSDEEHVFASDFYARKFDKKRTSLVTDILRQGQIIKLDEAHKNRPERAAQNYFTQRGYSVFRTENGLWKSLFGLLLWDELFDERAQIHNGFERMPSSLKSGTFYQDYEARIEAKLALLAAPQDALKATLKTTAQNFGTRNGVFRWSHAGLEAIRTLLDHAPDGGLAAILRAMAQDYRRMKDGFPDLMRVKDGALDFVEIKARGDVIRRNQLTRIQQLQSAGFKTEIGRVEWIIDPDQTYVVVDVETTGGRPGLHRLTEIGAVKMRGGEVVDQWQSLINPERSIPPNITRLTGISQDMVVGAPVFAQIADEFATFMGDAIFAAHNVNFDYGFIKMEYERIGKPFRHPKICTVSSMRRFYPGHKSYSLKNLCRDFDIDLNSHHRALCDARAAAQLLNLVNARRLED